MNVAAALHTIVLAYCRMSMTVVNYSIERADVRRRTSVENVIVVSTQLWQQPESVSMRRWIARLRIHSGEKSRRSFRRLKENMAAAAGHAPHAYPYAALLAIGDGLPHYQSVKFARFNLANNNYL
jgi:hypothetical protein